MAITKLVAVVSNTSPAAASTVAGTTTVNISDLAWFQVYLDVQGATGGALDVYIQSRYGSLWVDWYHHPQMAAAAGSEKRVIVPESTSIVSTVGVDLVPALASGACVGGKPGDALRLCFVAGAGTSAGAAQVMRVIGFKS